MTKICAKCKIEKDISCFAKNKSKQDGLQVHCRECKKHSDAIHYLSHKTQQLARNRRLRMRYRDEVRQYKRNKGCHFCDEHEPCALDFHHLDKSKKDFIISAKVCISSPTLVWEEISKCIVICANCHRKLHAGLLKLNVNQTKGI